MFFLNFLINLNKKKEMKQNLIQDKSFNFSILSIELYKELSKNKEFIISKQFLRSATSIGANVNEAIAGYSKKDFTSKMSIASKEARETLYWIQLIEASNLIGYDYDTLKKECASIINILTSIVKTSQTKLINEKS